MKRHLPALLTAALIIATLLIWAGLAHVLQIPLCDPALTLKECTP